MIGRYVVCLTALVLLSSQGLSLEIADSSRRLVLELDCTAQSCAVSHLTIAGRDVAAPGGAMFTGIQREGAWYTSRDLLETPRIETQGNTVRVLDVQFGPRDFVVHEDWTFSRNADSVSWRIQRTYPAAGALDDMAMPAMAFADMATWTGALLDTGGVAWPRLMSNPRATYGAHAGRVTFWSAPSASCMRIDPNAASETALRFTHEQEGPFSLHYSVTGAPVTPKHDLRRFLVDKTDLWAPCKVEQGVVEAEFALSAPDYAREFDRGDLPGIDEDAVREICNTIGRIGVIDRGITGSNGWYSGYAVLQEHWLALLGIALNDDAYFANYALTLDTQRDQAITPEGRVRPRWAHNAGDSLPGTYDASGFYECQWGHFLDVQTCYVTNVAELFDFTGDLAWVRGHKDAGERALAYLMRRDTNQNGLYEMMTDSHAEAKGSDWLDVVWASFENAFVNAQLYNALRLWADVEDTLGDAGRAGQYRADADRLKEAFNRPIAEGGFWNPDRGWYIHWRDKDHAIHGNNLVLPVNFMAIAFGLCDQADRCKRILDQTEAAMQAESLFFWPACIYSYTQEEGHPTVNWPFPNYENGDIFLAWAEAGVRAYAAYDPAVALKYIRNVLAQYTRDGLAFQRYLRKSQAGAGDDILANNAMPVVALYRNLYGMRPRHNRLMLDPHLTPELDGTRLRYRLRGQDYNITLHIGHGEIAAANAAVAAGTPFAAALEPAAIRFFAGDASTAALSIARPENASLRVTIDAWGAEMKWTETGLDDQSFPRTIAGLVPGVAYTIRCNDQTLDPATIDPSGQLIFTPPPTASPRTFALSPR